MDKKIKIILMTAFANIATAEELPSQPQSEQDTMVQQEIITPIADETTVHKNKSLEKAKATSTMPLKKYKKRPYGRSTSYDTAKYGIAQTSAQHKTAEIADKEYKKFIQFTAGSYYVPKFGGNSGMNDSRMGYLAGLGIGYNFNKYFATNLEYSYYAPVKDTLLTLPIAHTWKISSNTFIVNAIVNITPNYPVTPYIKAGVGASVNKSDSFEITGLGGFKQSYPGKTKSQLAWQAGGGLSLKSSDRYVASVEYLAINRGSFETHNYYFQSNTQYSDPAKTKKSTEGVLKFNVMLKF